MEQNTKKQAQTPAPKKAMSDFRKALLWTAIPVLVLSIAGAGGTMSGSLWVGFGTFIATAFGLWSIAILVCIGFAIARKRQIAVGILAGIGIGVVGLGITCFSAASQW